MRPQIWPRRMVETLANQANQGQVIYIDRTVVRAAQSLKVGRLPARSMRLGRTAVRPYEKGDLPPADQGILLVGKPAKLRRRQG